MNVSQYHNNIPYYVTLMKVVYNSKDQDIGIRTSRGFVKDIFDPTVIVREPLTEYSVMLDLLRRDPDIATAFDIIVDFATYRGFDFIKGSKTQRDKAREKFRKLNWTSVNRNLLYSSLMYGDAFLELRDTKGNGTIDELWPLETTEMRIIYDIHGKVEGYIQRPFNLSGLTTQEILSQEQESGIHFKPDEVIHFRTKWIGSQVYSYSPIESASTSISSKLFASNYLMNIFINMPPRYVIHLAGAAEKQRNKLKNDWQAGKTNYKRNSLFSSSSDPKSEVKVNKIDPIYDEDLLKVLSYLRREVLKVTRVPQSWLEESASENRGITESEQRPFEVKVKSLQLEPYENNINNLLLPALGFKAKGTEAKQHILYKYNTLGHKEEKEILENLGMLRDMGLKPEAVVNYLDSRGILGLDPKDFEEEQLNKNMELNPSRSRMNPRTDDMTNKLDSQGVSAEGKKKADQISTRFTQYPYTLN